MFEYLALTDGTTTLDLTDGINYALVSYAPTVAPRKDNDLGGDGPYAGVAEIITFHAIGCTASEAYAAAAAVNALLDQAARWWRGDPGAAAVLLAMRVQGSTATSPLQVVIKGRASGGPPNVALPAAWNATLGRYVIQNIQITFVRRGQILGASEATATSTAATNPVVQTRTFTTNLGGSNPVAIVVGGFPIATLDAISAGVLFYADDGLKITPVTCQGMASGAFTAVNDAANKPLHATNILRYTPADSVSHQTNLNGPINTPYTDSTGLLSIYLVCRNNSATTTFVVSARVSGYDFQTATTPDIAVDTSTTDVRIVFLGTVRLDNAGASASPPLIAFNVRASAVSGTFDLGHYVAIISDTHSGAIAHPACGVGSLATNFQLAVDPRLLTDPTAAAIKMYDNSAPVRVLTMGCTGDPYVQSTGSTIAVLWLSSRGAYWRLVDVAATIVQVTTQATRQTAFLVPS